MTDLQMITLLIGLYGAILSTVLGLNEIRKAKRTVKVTCGNAYITPLMGTNQPTDFISISAVNRGFRPVVIKDADLLLSDKGKLIQPMTSIGKRPLPKKLEDGEDVTIYLDMERMRQLFQKVRSKNPESNNQVGLRYRCGI